MNLKPIEIAGLNGLFISSMKLSTRLEWQEACAENKHLMMPMLIFCCVVDKDGKRVKTLDEWDEWAGDNLGAASDLFNKCLDVAGSVDKAKKKVDDPSLQFALLLCRSLGKTLAQLGEEMDSQEFCIWFAEYQERPWGEFRDELNAATIASTVANFSGKSLKPNKEIKPIEFMPYSREKPKPSPQDADSLKELFGS